MNFRGSAATVAGLAALLALSACGGGDGAVAGPSSVDLDAAYTSVMAEASQALEASAEYTRAPDAAPATGAAPGAPLSYQGKPICTLGPAVKRGAQTGFLIAAHCTRNSDGDPLTGQFSAGGVTFNAPAEVARRGTGDDSAVIWTSEAADDTRLGGYPVAGSLTQAQVAALPAETPICMAGMITGTRCGGKSPVKADDEVFFQLVNQRGDSGAPVFVVRDGKAFVAGLLSSGDEGGGAYAHGSLFSMAADRIGVSPVTAP